MLVYKHDDCLLKDNGFNHPERKERINSILVSIKQINEFNIQTISSIDPSLLFKAKNVLITSKTLESLKKVLS